ncbi:Uncharacterised protein [Vibrio cholerae]|nr:Uncharacterised protein [Vibrio cholerae]
MRRVDRTRFYRMATQYPRFRCISLTRVAFSRHCP